MTLVQGGDVRAFERFYDRHSTVALSVAMRILDDYGLAADATQEAFFSFWRYRARYRLEYGAARPWLLTMVRHRAIDAWRRERNQHCSGRDDDAHLARQPATDDTEAKTIILHESEAVRDQLDQLPAHQRQVIELAYFGGFSHSEIANQLGLPLGTAKARMRLGLGKLRTALSEAPGAVI